MGKFEVLKVIINDEVIELHNENEIEDFYRAAAPEDQEEIRRQMEAFLWQYIEDPERGPSNEIIWTLLEYIDFIYDDCYDTQVDEYDIEKSWQQETRIYISPFTGKKYGLDGYWSPYEGFSEYEIDEIYEVKEKKVEVIKYVPINEED